MDSLKELHFSFLECELEIEWADKWLEKATIRLQGEEIGRLKGAFYNPKLKQYSTWECTVNSTDDQVKAQGKFKVCIAFAVGYWLIQKKPINHIHQ